ncbi:MAG: hypothetical protein IJ955_04105 [Oscillospiraceae bacterium]|nr:hypothetical protein [Oscillospiraceae bacterium]
MNPMDVDYGKLRRYDTSRPPLRQNFLFTGILRALCGISMMGQEYKIEKINMEGLKPPYILLCNHMYFVDFHLCSIATFPHRVNNIATIDGYYRRPFLMEWLGCMCKRKFTTDMSLLRSVKKILHEYGDIMCMYPEARYSPIGTTAILPDSLGKMVKMQNVPVVVLLHHGNYLHTPFWNYRKPRKVPLHSTMTQVLTAEEVKEKSAAEIGQIIRKAMEYDEYRWQREQNIHITEPFRAEGLHKVLYQCPHCFAESRMTSSGARLRCDACGKEWEMDTLGQLHAVEGETEFSHIPDWFEWERTQVRAQLKAGTYHFEDEVEIYSLPHAWRFQKLGKGKLIHDINDGFIVEGEHNGKPYRIHRPPLGMYGVHIEYDYCYVRPDDCIDISTENDSLYCYPTKQNVVTKLSFATEELYKIKMAERNEQKKAARLTAKNNTVK